ncbi:MAG: hypothetical protein A2X86_11005 [Bdellovibrionales bacterium GWA2_49_15]|nr:MAG: hypothetical protein A2X86_11005 [Bdellovibrionales bacterium GWA2_49_15]HAZ11505.1 hypothetical protein [Bdellovibrionales bacterium]
MAKKYLHQDKSFKELIEIVAAEMQINPFLVEKDYWIMHCLFGLQDQGFEFELKGGTSLSKAYKIIHRFSEDIDLKILPPEKMDVKAGKNHMKDTHVKSRQKYFEWLAKEIKIVDITAVRNYEFDDNKFRNAGITLNFQSNFESIPGVKPSVLLETGFDDTTPNRPLPISSWAVDKAISLGHFEYTDNRALDVKCYIPELTFVEKLQAIATKHRRFKESGKIDKNFMRHYYDLYCLLALPEIQSFLGSKDYHKRKAERFPLKDSPATLNTNGAFKLQTEKDFQLLNSTYLATKNLYYKGQPSLEEIFARIKQSLAKF